MNKKQTIAKTKWSVLDTLFIIFTSLTIVLLLFWIVGQLKGQNVFGQLPEWTVGIGSELWGFLISGGLSILTFWLKSSGKNSPNYFLWIFVSVVVLILLIGSVSLIFNQTQPNQPNQGKIRFSLNYPDPPEVIFFLQKKPIWIEGIKTLHVQKSGYFEAYDIDLPEINEKFVAKFNPEVKTSIYSDNAILVSKDICLIRKNNELPGDKCMAIFEITPHDEILLDNSDPNCVTICGNSVHGNVNLPSFISTAYAQSPPNKDLNIGWTIPTLETLNSSTENSFSHIKIESKYLHKKFTEANYYEYQIIVNETPLYINGFSPEDLKRSFDINKGISLEFGLENLNFSGKQNGIENLIVKFTFYNNSDYVSELFLEMDYIAIRNTPPSLLDKENEYQFQWEAEYHTTENKEYEVFNFSSVNVQKAIENKRKIDKSNLFYENKKLIGILRPPLNNNPNYGVIVGLELPSKQIIFTFDKKEANELLFWAKEQPNNVFRSDIYLYRIIGH